ncbi:single-stranded DNA-binding protein [Formosa sp. A9]|uniref:single-stranded DNA-binding protein n=1 Tax=Formosa sp. A9 TaxID=3442641 RepID=UPI003EBCCE55
MNSLRNKVQLIGNLGQDPEILNLESGKTLAKFSIATNESYKTSSGEKITDTQWHNIVAWGQTAKLAETYLTKGKEVAIEGKLVTRSFETKDGEKRYVTEVVCHQVLMLGK